MQSMGDQLVGYAAIVRDETIARADAGGDDDLPPEERPNREEVSPGCLLKFSDQVEMYGMTVMYTCPARGVGWFLGLLIEGSTIQTQSFEAQYVTDRLPADPEEAPMPIFAEPEPTEPAA